MAKLLGDDDDDSDDSDYEYHAGDANLYDSCFDSCDEIKFLRDCLMQVSQQDPNTYARMLSLLD